MKKEIEGKILEIDRPRLLARIRKLGGRKIFDASLKALYFDFPDSRLKKKAGVVRIRKEGKKTFWTAKTKRSASGARIMDEWETEIADFDTARKILEGIGLRITHEIRKHRVSYRLGKSRLEIDKFAGIPAFLEIESPDVKSLHQTVSRLGYQKKEMKTWNTFELLHHYQRKKKRRPRA